MADGGVPRSGSLADRIAALSASNKSRPSTGPGAQDAHQRIASGGSVKERMAKFQNPESKPLEVKGSFALGAPAPSGARLERPLQGKSWSGVPPPSLSPQPTGTGSTISSAKRPAAPPSTASSDSLPPSNSSERASTPTPPSTIPPSSPRDPRLAIPTGTATPNSMRVETGSIASSTDNRAEALTPTPGSPAFSTAAESELAVPEMRGEEVVENEKIVERLREDKERDLVEEQRHADGDSDELREHHGSDDEVVERQTPRKGAVPPVSLEDGDEIAEEEELKPTAEPVVSAAEPAHTAAVAQATEDLARLSVDLTPSDAGSQPATPATPGFKQESNSAPAVSEPAPAKSETPTQDAGADEESTPPALGGSQNLESPPPAQLPTSMTFRPSTSLSSLSSCASSNPPPASPERSTKRSPSRSPTLSPGKPAGPQRPKSPYDTDEEDGGEGGWASVIVRS